MGFTLYGILAALAMAAMLAATYLAGRKSGLDYGSLIRFAVLAIPLALIGSRLVYCLASLPYYTETIGRPELIFVLPDGLCISAGILSCPTTCPTSPTRCWGRSTIWWRRSA